MAWIIEISKQAERDLGRFDHQTSQRVIKFLMTRVAGLENPRAIGEALQGAELGKYWKYRVGDYRIIADIQDKHITIIVVRIGNRREIYRR